MNTHSKTPALFVIEIQAENISALLHIMSIMQFCYLVSSDIWGCECPDFYPQSQPTSHADWAHKVVQQIQSLTSKELLM